jgi:hypothetical protein
LIGEIPEERASLVRDGSEAGDKAHLKALNLLKTFSGEDKLLSNLRSSSLI